MISFVELIIGETQKILMNKGIPAAKVTPDMNFLRDLQMDSLELATLIVTLEELTHLDPFRSGFKSFHTVEQLAALYEQATK